MSAGWVAASARGRLLTRRRLGAAGARRVAESGDGAAAVAALAGSPYRRAVLPTMPVADANRAIGSVCVWHLRVLAGWVPPRATDVVRVFAGRFELVNIADRMSVMATGAPAPAPYALGALAVAWPRVAGASTPEDLRAALSGSAWGDPGMTEAVKVAVALEARWASWLAAVMPDQGEWAAGAAALALAGPVAAGMPVPPAALGDLRRMLGRGWVAQGDIAALAGSLPRTAAWVLDTVERPEDLWQARARWWRRVDRDAAATLRTARPGPAVVGAAAARLVADARRAQSALEAAAWGPIGMETFDAVA